MAHGAFKVLDSDIHIIEPPDLWPRYIDPAFRDRAPVGLTEDEGDLRLALGGKPWGRVAIDADRSRRRQGRNYALNQERWRPYAERGWTSRSSWRRWTSRASTSPWSIHRAGSSRCR